MKGAVPDFIRKQAEHAFGPVFHLIAPKYSSNQGGNAISLPASVAFSQERQVERFEIGIVKC